MKKKKIMKTVQLIEKSDLESVESKLYYFFGSDTGWLKRNADILYVHYIKEDQEPKITRLIEQATTSDLKEMKEHLIKRLDNLRQNLADKKEEVDNYEKNIESAKRHLETISSKDTFKEAVLSLI